MAISKIGDHLDAIAGLEALVRLSGDSSERQGLIGGRLKRLYRDAVGSESGETVQYLSRAIEHYENASAFLTDAKLAFAADRVDDACRSLEKASGREPDDEDMETIRQLLQRCR